MTTTDSRAAQLAESRYRNGYGPTLAEPWEQLDTGMREFLANEAVSWLRSATAAGLVAENPTAIVDADNPIPLRWGLNDVQWGDDDSVVVMLSGPDGEPYWLELDQEQAAVLREDLAGPDGEPETEEPETSTRPCGHDDYHDAHEWDDRPGIWCPGHSIASASAP
ncbi:hypothetical protein ACIA78_21460 [Streptomyces xanthochromogenes]|uniref:hypothetical protein n=1 Tax=Streptomyces xanthochromogenes TaxID=67384 RepID=UPI003798CA88